jgi:serine protease AprX
VGRVLLISLVAFLSLSGQAFADVAILQYDRSATSSEELAREVHALGAETALFQELPFVAVRGSAAELGSAASLRGVVSSHANEQMEYHLHNSVPIAYGGAHPQPVWDLGYDGRGVNVAVIDSGTDGLHPDLEQRVVKNYKIVHDVFTTDLAPLEQRVQECPVACDTDTTSGHGTHVSGTMVGDGTASNGYHTGVAPGAGLVSYGTGEGIAVLWALLAMDHLLAHPELNVVAVNNSWGPTDDAARFDPADPRNVATKALHDAGITVVFSAGNSGPNPENPTGESDCSTEGTGATCMINQLSVAPWTLSVANTRTDQGTLPGEQTLNYTSSRGDSTPRQVGDMTITYQPTLAAPGTNIWASRSITGATMLGSCTVIAAEPPACTEGRPEDFPRYVPSSGTSMAAPHVTAAVAVLQSKALQTLGRKLSPDEVRDLLVRSAAPMTKNDSFYDWPCGEPYYPVTCPIEDFGGTTDQPYVSWQVGAGALDIRAALGLIDVMAQHAKKSKKPKPVK